MSNDFRFLMYQSAEENVSINAIIKDETIWLSQKGMAELFGCSTDNISLHLKNIFSDGELTKDSVTEKISVTCPQMVKIILLSSTIWTRLSPSATASTLAARRTSASGQPAS